MRIKDWDLDVRGINYSICKGRVWILMPTKKGMIGGKQCEFPIINFTTQDTHRAFIKLLQHCFGGFMKSRNYVSFDNWDDEKGEKKVRKPMVFVTPAPRKKR